MQPRTQLVQLLKGLERAERIGLEILELFAQRVGRKLHGQAQLLLRRLERLLLLQLGEDVARAGDHRRRQSGQRRDVDAVRAVGTTWYDAMQEAHGLALLEHLDAPVAYAWQSLRERGELVVMRREDGAAAKAGRVMDVLDHGLRDGHSVVGRRPPPHLVE